MTVREHAVREGEAPKGQGRKPPHSVREHAVREGEAPAEPRLAGRLALTTNAAESRTAS